MDAKTSKSKTHKVITLVCLILLAILSISLGMRSIQVKRAQQEELLLTQTKELSKNLESLSIKVTNIGDSSVKALDEKKECELKTLKGKLKHGQTEDLKVVFLTFDDGPSKHTQEVLDLLAKYNVKATFFVNGREGSLSIYKAMADAGHILGNHTYSHQYNLYDTPDLFYGDVESLNDLIKRATGQENISKMFRFPGGSLNSNKTCIKGILDRGYNYADWNVSSGDSSTNPIQPEDMAAQVIDSVHQHHVSVVLCHAENKETSRKALPQIIETLIKEGYTFLPMDAAYTYPRHATL